MQKSLTALALGASLALGTAAATVATTPPASAAALTTYKVKSGDTLGAIAAKYKTTGAHLASLNGISNSNLIRVGAVLKVPALTPASAPLPASPASSNLITKKVIGKSVKGHAIYAYLVGDAKATKTAMILGNMHGDEPRSDDAAYAIINGPKVKGIKIWVVPTINPDGLARGTRTNGHGVDLNHNWGDYWTKTSTGRYYSGTTPMSEPETKAFFAFVNTVKPRYLVSLHQPYAAIDNERVKSRTLQSNLSKYLGLPIKWTGSNKTVSHGTMVGYVNAKVAPTAAITVEFSASPSTTWLNTTARKGLVKAVGGTY